MARNLTVTFCGRTHTGLVRLVNEDAILMARLAPLVEQEEGVLAEPDLEQTGLLLTVADGLGGRDAGEVLSRAVVDAVRAVVSDWRPGVDVFATLEAAVRDAHRAALSLVADPSRRGAASTATLMMLWGTTAYIVHAGDSRAYLLREGRLYRATIDHTTLELLVRSGHISRDEAESGCWQCGPLNLLGMAPEIHPALVKVALRRGDRLVLCTDGLTSHVKDAQLLELLTERSDAAATCERLVATACELGGEDNVTVIVVDVDGEGFASSTLDDDPERVVETVREPLFEHFVALGDHTFDRTPVVT